MIRTKIAELLFFFGEGVFVVGVVLSRDLYSFAVKNFTPSKGRITLISFSNRLSFYSGFRTLTSKNRK